MKKSALIKCCIILFLLNSEILASTSACIVNMDIVSYNLEESNYFDELTIFKYFDKYNTSEIASEDRYFYVIYSLAKINIEEKCCKTDYSSKTFPISSMGCGGLMDSPWSMKCHDTHHTGRSPYITVDTCEEVWKFETWGTAWGGPAIDDNGTIYIGAYPLHAVYQNGTEKWTFNTDGYFTSVTPAIDENGTIYIGTRGAGDSYFYAINPDGKMKWRHPISETYSSPAIANDGSIIFTDTNNWNIIALYPNGTLRWSFHTNHVVYSSPAIGDDGTIYCGSHDTYLYALYPNNGTLKWKYKTDGWIRVSPCIGDDGTIYVVSLDNYLHAVNPDGSFKWKTDVGAGTSPTIGQDGTIYAGYTHLYAVNPSDGSVKWTFDVGGTMRGGTPCNSVDGTIYVGTSDGGQLIAINPDGTEKWRKSIGKCESAPAIGEDGVVYIGSYSGNCLYAFGIGELAADANGPYYGLVNDPVQFKGVEMGGYSPHSYHWNFGDTHSSDEQNPKHTYTSAGNYTVTLTVTDNTGNTSSDTTSAWIQTTNNPPTKPSISGPTNGKIDTKYSFILQSTDPDGNPISYYVNWGDGMYSGWTNYVDTGTEITLKHTWERVNTFTIRAKVRDTFGLESDETEFEIKISNPRTRVWLRFLDMFPILERILGLLS